MLLLHFSCHGLKDDSGQLYFAAADTEVAQLDASAVPAEFVSRHMARSRSSTILMLLDCCYSGAIARGLSFRAGDTVDVDDHLGGHGRAIMTASSAMEYAFEGDDLTGEGQPSVFTSAVVQALRTGEADRDQDHLISVRELYDYVSDEVRERTPNQRPNLLSHLEGELYIARSRWVGPAPLPRPVAPLPGPAVLTRADLWPVVLAVVGGALIVLGWFIPWQYGSSAKDLIAENDVPRENLMLGLLLVPGLLAPAVAFAIPGARASPRARRACTALLVLAGGAAGVVWAEVARTAGGPFEVGPYVTLIGALAVVVAVTVALSVLTPRADGRWPWLGDALVAEAGVAAGILFLTGPLTNYGSQDAANHAVAIVSAVLAFAAAAVAGVRLIAPGTDARRRAILAVIAASAATVGIAVPPGDWPVLVAGLVMTGGAVRAAGSRG